MFKRCIAALAAALLLAGCAVERATVFVVDESGKVVGHAVKGTGKVIDGTGKEIGQLVDGTDKAVDPNGKHIGKAVDAADKWVVDPAGKQIGRVVGGGGKVVIPAGDAPEVGATVWLAVYDRTHSTEITRGENAGREIRNSNVVREFERLGTWTGARLEIPLNMAEAAARGRYGCAVIVQQGRNGPVLGAASLVLENLQ